MLFQCCWSSLRALPAQAALKVLATTPDWGALTQELGGDRVNVYVATTALQDVHRVEARPSLVARARSADLVVATGAELEVGWLPVLIQESGNARIQPGAPGYFEAARRSGCSKCRSKLDRSMGDIHPQGNPHVQLDPHNIALVAQALSARLAQLDPAQAAYYAARGKDFDARWEAAIKALGSEGRAAARVRRWSSCIATRCTCATGSASSKWPRSSPSPACRRRRPTSARWSASSPPRRRG